MGRTLSYNSGVKAKNGGGTKRGGGGGSGAAKAHAISSLFGLIATPRNKPNKKKKNNSSNNNSHNKGTNENNNNNNNNSNNDKEETKSNKRDKITPPSKKNKDKKNKNSAFNKKKDTTAKKKKKKDNKTKTKPVKALGPNHHAKHRRPKPHSIKVDNRRPSRGDIQIPIKSFQKKPLHFQLHMPPPPPPSTTTTSTKSCSLLRDMPWYRHYANDGSSVPHYSEENQDGPSASSSHAGSILPCSLFPANTLRQMDLELRAFCRYVRLTPSERDAREHLVQHVSHVCRALFHDKRTTTTAPTPNHAVVRLQAFGSHATPQVCCFASDVDLALWGVVPAATHISFVSSMEGEASSRKREEQISRWKRALQEAHDEKVAKKEEGGSNKDTGPCSNTKTHQTDNENHYTANNNKKEEEPDFCKENVAKEEEDCINNNKKKKETIGPSSVPCKKDDEHCNASTVKEDAVDCETKKPTMSNDANNAAKGDEFLFVIDRVGGAARVFGGPEVDDDDNGKRGTDDKAKDPTSGSSRKQSSSSTGASSSSDNQDAAAARGSKKEPTLLLEKSNNNNNKVERGDVDDKDEPAGASNDDPVVYHKAEFGGKNDTPAVTVDVETREPAGTKEDPLVVNDDGETDEAAQKTPGSSKKAILKDVVDLCSDSDDDDDDSDDDSADKLQSFRRKRSHSDVLPTDDEDDERWKALVTEQKRRTVSLSSSTSGEGDHDDESCHHDMQVSFVSRAAPPHHKQQVVGPTGQTRKLVIGALQSLGRKMRQSPLTHTVEVRRFARVPIITMATHLGFEGDIAIGGHNGTDTSQYASVQTQRFQSFATVVLVLKILLIQQGLDKPFTGGLGSYKLYVLVAHHLERHVALGGSDRPSDILVAFFFRYGGIRNTGNMNSGAATRLSQNVVLRSDGGSADLQPVFHIDHCTRLFGICWERLLQQSEAGRQSSFLGSIIDATKLRRDREQCLRKADLWQKNNSRSKATSAKSNGNRKVGHVFTNPNGRNESYSAAGGTDDDNDEASRLMAGYGLQRGPRGGLVPRSRPDVEARRAAKRANPNAEVLGRARKNRKSKKKQNRDKAVKEFATRAL